MKNYISRANKRISISWAAGLLSASYFLSLILGALRDRLVATNFGIEQGVSPDTESYLAAFKFPDFMFVLLVSGALSVTLIPVFNQRYNTGNKKSSWELINSLLNFMLVLTIIGSLVAFALADVIIKDVMARNLDPVFQEKAVGMMRILVLSPVLFSVSNIFVSVQQAVGRFFFFALAPITYNIGIIFGILYLGDYFGIYGAALGVVIGAVLQMLVSFMGMKGLGFKYERQIFWRNLGFKRVLKLLPARSFDQSLDYLMAIIETSIAGSLKKTAITVYTYANSLHLAPVSLIGVAISTAAFPQMSERINQGRSDLFIKELREVFRVVVWIALPVCMIAYIGRGYIVRLQVGAGNPVISKLLALLVIAMFFRVIFHVISRAFYANQDTRTPLIISIIAIAFNVVAAVYLAKVRGMGVEGLAIAQSATATIEVIILIIVFQLRYQTFISLKFMSSMLSMALATMVTGLLTYVLVSRVFPLLAGDTGFSTLVPKFGLIVGISGVVYIAISDLLGIKESEPIVGRLLKIVDKPIK